jgi:hypothetical protein
MNELTNRAMSLLSQVSALNKKHEEIARITGRKFNVFSILGVESRETSTHSAFLVELLNPKGDHGQGSLFLKLFIEVLERKRRKAPKDEESGYSKMKIPEKEEIESVSVEKEKHLGRINKEKTKGGRADILIQSLNGNICIENKIYARDQENQLIRYYEKYGSNGLILYLTLYGNKATDWSTTLGEKKLELGKDYFKISYKKDILDWLVKCQNAVIDVPTVRDVIGQYIYLIKKLTGQGMGTLEKRESINLIAKLGKTTEGQNDLIALKQSFDVFLEDVEGKLNKLRGKLVLDGFVRNGKTIEIWTGKDQSNNLNSVLYIPLNQLPDGSKKDLKIRLSPKGWAVELWNGWLGDSKREDPNLLEMKYDVTVEQMAVEITKIVEGVMRESD